MPQQGFNTPEWFYSTNIYEVNLRQYTREGTILAFMEELPRLKSMGVGTLWFMPLTPISIKKRKGTLGSYYACSDYKAINPEFGTISDFKNLVERAHEMGFKVIIDWVANHTGWDHIWTISHPEYFKKDEALQDFKVASGMDDIIELDYDHPAVAPAMIDAMQYWIETFDIDGFRCDLAFWVRLDFWKQARTELEKIKTLCWLGEFDEMDTPAYGEAFDASYSWTWMHQTEDYCKGRKTLADLVNLLKRYDDLGNQCMRCWFTSNHDENSWNGTEYEKYGALAIVLSVFSMTWNGIPLIYSGQELPNGKRLLFFDKDIIPWIGINELAPFYTVFLRLHGTHPALRANDPEVQTVILKQDRSETTLVYKRQRYEKEVLVILNFSGQHESIAITDERLQDLYAEVITGEIWDTTETRSIEIPAWGFAVYISETV